MCATCSKSYLTKDKEATKPSLVKLKNYGNGAHPVSQILGQKVKAEHLEVVASLGYILKSRQAWVINEISYQNDKWESAGNIAQWQ